MNDLTKIELEHSDEWSNELIEIYDNPVVRFLIQLLPGGLGSGVDTLVMRQIADYRKRRLKEFFDELSTGAKLLTEELVRSDDFLHCYFATTSAVLRSRRKEKIRWLARLLSSAVDSSLVNGTSDDYDYILKILDELTFEEIKILLRIREREIEARGGAWHAVAAPRVNKFWTNLRDELASELGISGADVDQRLIRTERTGCISLSRAGAMEVAPQYAATTSTFDQLVQLARLDHFP